MRWSRRPRSGADPGQRRQLGELSGTRQQDLITGHSAGFARVPALLTGVHHGTPRPGACHACSQPVPGFEALVLDDFALQPLIDAQADDLLEVIEHGSRNAIERCETHEAAASAARWLVASTR